MTDAGTPTAGECCGDDVGDVVLDPALLAFRDAATAALLADPDDCARTLSAVARLAVPAFADWCVIDLRRDDGALERVEVFHPDPARAEAAASLRRCGPADAGAGRVVREGRAELRPDVDGDELRQRASCGEEHLRAAVALGIASWIVVPLPGRAETLGALSFVLGESGRRYGESDLAFACELGRRAGLALENARLYRELDRSRLAAARAAELRQRLLALASALARAITRPEVVAAAIEHGAAATGAVAAVVCLPTAGATELEIVHSAGYSDDVLARVQFPISLEGPLAEAFRRGRAVFLEDPEDLARRYPTLARTTRTVVHESWAALPLGPGGHAGVLGFAFGGSRAFPEDERSFMVALAHQLAQALDRARLHEDSERARQRAEVLGRLHEQMRAVVGHDLRTPLSAVVIAAKMLQRSDGLDHRHRAAVDRIVSSAGRMARMIGDLLQLATIRPGDMLSIERGPARIEEICAAAIGELQAAHPGRSITLSLSGEGSGDWDRRRLEQVVSNLVGNALQHGSQDGEVRVRAVGADGRLTLEIHNRGPAIPAELLPHLFEPYRRGDRGGFGLGLFIVREIVRAHGGEVDVRSDPGGTTFTVRLPQAAPRPRADARR